MPSDTTALSKLLDKLEDVSAADQVNIADVVEVFGHRSFAALMLVFALIAVSPASVVPGVTSVVAVLEFVLIVQMLFGRRHLWLPEVLARRDFAGEKLRNGVAKFRKPIAWIEKFLKPRLSFLTRRPWTWPWLVMILCLTLVMPLLEVIPGAGSLAATVIALFAGAILTKDGVLIILAGVALVGVLALIGWVGVTVF